MYRVSLLVVLLVCFASDAYAQKQTHSNSEVSKLTETSIEVSIIADRKNRIPRFCASLKDSYFKGMPDKKVVVHPEIEFWEIRFKGKPLADSVVLEFDSSPLHPKQVKPIEQLGDATLTLPCSKGMTTGEKLRFEPQPHKNTIGYWAVASDAVHWRIKVSQPGEFNVGLLQGSGNRGGGRYRVTIHEPAEEKGFKPKEDSLSAIEADVELTGHFQNFIWKHAGTIDIEKPGEYILKIQPTKINDIALMDVRQVHLSPKR